MGIVRVIGVSGGKGGVGKSNVAVNLAVALGAKGRRVVLLDADLGLANVDVLLGLKPRRTIEDVLAGRCTLREVLVPGPNGIQVVPASSGTQRMAELKTAEQGGLIQAFSELGDQCDVLIVDTAAGLASTVTNFLVASQHVVVVVCDEPASITDAYALIKLLHQQYRIQQFQVLANMVRDPADGRQLFDKLAKVSGRFLDVALTYAGAIPFDDNVRRAVKRQRAVTDQYPSSKASVAYAQLASYMDSLPKMPGPRGHLEFFAEQLLEASMSSARPASRPALEAAS